MRTRIIIVNIINLVYRLLAASRLCHFCTLVPQLSCWVANLSPLFKSSVKLTIQLQVYIK